MPFTPDEIHDIPIILSQPRFGTYLAEKNGNVTSALELYLWNLKLSSAFMVPLQICEVCIRNTIVTAIERVYGNNWPWLQSFRISLKNPPRSYSPRADLIGKQYLPSPGKIVAELKFIFWEQMLTRTHDQTIWNPYFRDMFPNTDTNETIQTLRAEGYNSINKIRDLRNRIAHHEPIFYRNIQEEYDRIRKIIYWVNQTSADWLDNIETVTSFIVTKP